MISKQRALIRLLLTGAFSLLAFAAPRATGQLDRPMAAQTLSNIFDIWKLPLEERKKSYQIQFKFDVHYSDRGWNVTWGSVDGTPAYLPLANCPQQLKPGRRYSLSGVVYPDQEQFDWDRTTLTLLGEYPLKFEHIDRLDVGQAFRSKLVSVDALVDSVREDSGRWTLRVLDSHFSATAVVASGTNILRVSAGDFVRLSGVYSVQYDKDGQLKEVTLFVPRAQDVVVTGNLAGDPRFNGTLQKSEDIREDSRASRIYVVEGIVRNHEPGKWLTIWDETGQIMIQSEQTLPVRIGQRVRAFGRPQLLGIERCLRGGFYRPVSNRPENASDEALPNRLYLAEQVRTFRLKQGRQPPVVTLRATVTWSDTNTPFAYVQDASGGLKVLNPTWIGINASSPGAIVTVEGTITQDEFVPAITNAVLTRAGWSGVLEAPLVSLEQAMTGVDDGRMIQMRGYVRQVTRTNRLTCLHLSTSWGEILVYCPQREGLETLTESVVRVSGVCVARANSRHQLTSIELWSSEGAELKVEEAKPDDIFALPAKSLASLRQFSIERALNRRVLTSGTVVLHAPGQYVYVQDGENAVFALSRQTNQLQIGDRVEIVGFPGNEGRKFVLREAAFRRVGSGHEPSPTPISAADAVNLELEGLLVKTEGAIFNAIQKNASMVLLIQAGQRVFEAHLDLDADRSSELASLQPGALISATGVYKIQRDEHGAPRSFMLHLRRESDVKVLKAAPWWTFSRLLSVLLAVGAISGFALVWALVMSRKNNLLNQAQAELQRANDELEHRVEKRTQELRDQVEAKEKARAELALTQRRLIAASRQAGMAEVATGVLHNVGNVLNSVNVSSTLISERLRNSRIELVSKCAALLQKPAADLARFLTEDPRGKTLPAYLQQLGSNLEQEKTFIRTEMDSLSKNIEHIKVIVSMQQSHAKSAGVLEEIDPKDLLDDALQIQRAGLERHNIELVLDCEPVPRLLLDRHKILQILINLIGNAKWALDHRESGRQLRCSLRRVNGDLVQFVVEDNGIGIPRENLNRIFTQGFTTRKGGHGFGLHSGANSAREIGGSLSVTSEGPGRGARFTLEIPVLPVEVATPAAEPVAI